jgi:hypothetical protein
VPARVRHQPRPSLLPSINSTPTEAKQ